MEWVRRTLPWLESRQSGNSLVAVQKKQEEYREYRRKHKPPRWNKIILKIYTKNLHFTIFIWTFWQSGAKGKVGDQFQHSSDEAKVVKQTRFVTKGELWPEDPFFYKKKIFFSLHPIWRKNDNGYTTCLEWTLGVRERIWRVASCRANEAWETWASCK